MQAVLGPIGKIGTGILKARDSFAMLTYSNNVFAQAFGKMGFALMKTPVLIAIGLLIAAFAYLYTTSDEFRAFVDGTLKTVMERLGAAFDRIWTAIQPLVDVILNELLPSLATALQPILELIIGTLGVLLPLIGDLLAGAFEFLTPIIKAAVDIITVLVKIVGGLITVIFEFFKALFTGDWTKFGKMFDKIIKDIGAGILKLFEGAVNMVIDGINGLLNAFFNGLGGGIADAVSVFSGGTVNLKKPGLISKVKFQIPGLAEGGTVMPSRGGSLVNVAEAGQAERIEPLDENGLSKRDKVLIAALSGGSGGGSTINVYPSAGMDERELADMVSRRIAFEIRKGAF
jgi:phage-related protein